MERRKFLIGAGSAAVGTSALIGSGAFTQVKADREVKIKVADDNDALLAFQASEGPNGDYAEESNGTLTIDTSNLGGSSGVNQDASTRIRDVFEIQNEGTQTVVLYHEVEDQPFGFYSDSTPYSETEEEFDNGLGNHNPGASPPVNKPIRHVLKPGDTMKEIGFDVDPRDFEEPNQSTTLTFTWVAKAVSAYDGFDPSLDNENPEHTSS